MCLNAYVFRFNLPVYYCVCSVFLKTKMRRQSYFAHIFRDQKIECYGWCRSLFKSAPYLDPIDIFVIPFLVLTLFVHPCNVFCSLESCPKLHLNILANRSVPGSYLTVLYRFFCRLAYFANAHTWVLEGFCI